MSDRRVVVLDVVGLQAEHITPERTPNLARLCSTVGSLQPPFPAVTIPAQTTLATGRSPATHGDVANGAYDRERDAVEFWGRPTGERTRIWEAAREAGVTTGALFFQHLLDTTADVAVTPKPIEDEENTLIEMHCHTNPDGFYDDLREAYGHFPLHNYWGPIASAESSRWILSAARESVARYDPDTLWVYLPHLDYAGLRHGPGPELNEELAVVDGMIGEFVDALRDDRWDETAVLVVSEYGFHGVDTPVFPNRALREVGLLATKPDPKADDEDATVLDLPGSRAFAMVDHQVAHVYCDEEVKAEVRERLAALPGVERVLERGDDAGGDAADGDARDGPTGDVLAAWGIDHPNAGDLVLVADRNAWFSYYWWSDEAEAPHYATDVDIHEKPGFDPCELFLGDAGLVSTDASLVGGSHGRVDPEAYGVFALGGPGAPALPAEVGTVDARAVAPTVADLLGVHDELAAAMGFERESVLARLGRGRETTDAR